MGERPPYARSARITTPRQLRGPSMTVGSSVGTAAPAANVNDAGRKLPDDAAPNEQQVYVLPTKQSDAKFADISANVYNRGGLADLFAIPLTRINKDFVTGPGSAKSWRPTMDCPLLGKAPGASLLARAFAGTVLRWEHWQP